MAAGLALPLALLYQLFSMPCLPTPPRGKWWLAQRSFSSCSGRRRWPYFLAVIAALYPLYTLSLYLAVLFLAVALLGQRVFIHNMGATLLVLFAPWLAQFHLEWLVPLLGGLWWGKTGGAWIGALAALWGQLLFGMAGAAPDLLAAVGTAPSIPSLIEQFSPAGSLETLLLLVTPLAPNPTLLLYHLLQVVLWAMVAALIGGFAERLWAAAEAPLAHRCGLFAGAVLLFAGHLGLASWLEQYAGDRLYRLAPQIVLELLAVTVLAALLEVVRDFVEHPLPGSLPGPARPSRCARLFHRARRPAARPARTRLSSAAATGIRPVSASTEGGRLPAPARAPDLPRRRPKKQPPDDIIKIELD